MENRLFQVPFPKNLIMPIILRAFGTNPPNQAIEKELCNDLTPEQTTKIVDNFTPEARLLYTTTISYKMPEVRSYILNARMTIA